MSDLLVYDDDDINGASEKYGCTCNSCILAYRAGKNPPVEQKKSLNPEDSFMLDFIGIGFQAGVRMAQAEIAKLYPAVRDLSLDVDALRAEWAENEAETGELLHFNKYGDGALVVRHSWGYRWIAALFLDHMEQIGAEHFVRQEIEITPALTSGVDGIMIEVSRLDWWRQNRKGKK